MAYQPHPIIKLKSYIPQPQFFLFSKIAAGTTFFSSLHQFGHTFLNQSALAILKEVLRVSMSTQAEMLEHIFRRLLADQRLSRSIVVEQEEWTQALPRSHWEEPRVSGKRMASRARQSLTLGTSTSTLTCGKIKSLDVTLDGPAGFADGS